MGWLGTKRLPSEGPEPILGPGQSRPLPTERVRDFSLQVKRAGTNVMRVTIKASTQAKAVMYCQNRWPDAQITLIK